MGSSIVDLKTNLNLPLVRGGGKLLKKKMGTSAAINKTQTLDNQKGYDSFIPHW